MADEIPPVVLTTKVAAMRSGGIIYYTVESVAILMAEAYQAAIAAGWETKALDPINDFFREAYNASV